MKLTEKAIFPALLLGFLLSACAQVPAVETPSPMLQPTGTASGSFWESAPLTLAGEELTSAVMLDYTNSKEGYPLWSDDRMDQEAGLEEAFQEWGFSVEDPFYQYSDSGGEEGGALTFYYDAELDCALGIFWRDEGRLYGFGLNRSFPVNREGFDGWLDGPESGWGEIYGGSTKEWTDAPFAETKRYDDQGRLSYAEGYITHGRLHYYYIYQDDGPIPAYLLRIDDNMGYADPLLIRYSERLIPGPLPEGSPLTLAGEELYSAVMMDKEEPYNFSSGTAANLEGWFRLLGFRAEEPFYEYYGPDGTLQLTLWYDPESGVGLGIRYPGYGFGFCSTGWATEEEPHGEGFDWAYGWYRWEDDPFTLPPYDASEAQDYEERREWDEEGRLRSLAAYGTLEYWPPVKENPLPLWEFTYDYDEQGALRHRRVFSHYTAFTTNPGQDGYYDDQGRLAYEDGYITHGSTDTYYIYEGDAKEPSYALYLDQSHQFYFPQFVRYH